jgi:hypothetical protein
VFGHGLGDGTCDLEVTALGCQELFPAGVSLTASFLSPAFVILNVPLARVTILPCLCDDDDVRAVTVRAVTVLDVIVIVSVHGSDAQVTVTVIVVSLSVAPPPTLAGEIASAAWNG